MKFTGTEAQIGIRHLAPLMLCILATAIPLRTHIASWTILMFLGCAATRLIYASRGWRLPSIWIKLVALAVGVCGITMNYGTIIGIEAGLSVLLILVSLKTLETSGPRDFQVLTLLGFFLCLCALFFSQELSRWLYLAFIMVGFFAQLLAFHTRGAQIGRRRMVRQTGMLLLQALPIIILLFTFFPRSYGGLKFQFGRSMVGFAGLSDRMEPGSIAELALREDVAFQAGFPDGKIPPQSELYWRGMVLWGGDGLTWRRGDGLIRDSRPGPLAGEPVRQQIILQPHGGRYIFALDRPSIAMNQGITMEPGGYFLSNRPVSSPLKYEVTSRPISREQRLSPDRMYAALRKPESLSPLVNALAQSWREQSSSDEQVIDRGLQYFAKEGFTYSLQPGTYAENGLEDFLFRRRTGFCEHYAGAFATLMRLAGIPSRVVLGYHGGEYNTFGQLITVRQSDAHAWCEVWLKGVGWKRVDPTNVIAPERINSGLESYLEAQSGSDAGRAAGVMRNSGFRNALRDARLLWDNISYQWDLRVLNFDEDSQQAFLLWIGVGSLDWTSLALFLSVVVIVVLSVLGLILRKPAKRAELAALRIYDRFCLLLAKRGVLRDVSEPPKSYVERAASQLPELAPAIHRVGDAYVRHRFARNPAPLTELIEALQQFERALRETRRAPSTPEPV